MGAWATTDSGADMRSVQCVFSRDVGSKGSGDATTAHAAGSATKQSPTARIQALRPQDAHPTSAASLSAVAPRVSSPLSKDLTRPLSPKRLKRARKVRSLKEHHTAHLRNHGLVGVERRCVGRAARCVHDRATSPDPVRF